MNKYDQQQSDYKRRERPPQPPSYQSDLKLNDDYKQPNKEQLLRRLQNVATKYELAGGAIVKLRKLEAFDIVVICDDSSSMNNPAHDIPADQPFLKVESRWEELKSRVMQIVEIATCLDQDGIDVYFLNQEPVYNVSDPEVCRLLFDTKPSGYTPLSQTYQRVLREKLTDPEKNVLIIVATDGEPNKKDRHGTWRKDTHGFYDLLKNRTQPSRSPTAIMACTDSDAEIGWMNMMDETVPCIDVIDDYHAERREVLDCQGRSFPFSLGDYVVKTLLGPIDPVYDNLDEKKLTLKAKAEYMGLPPPQEVAECCTIC
jgi:hypothetical protein